jgi:hypothetical protein
VGAADGCVATAGAGLSLCGRNPNCETSRNGAATSVPSKPYAISARRAGTRGQSSATSSPGASAIPAYTAYNACTCARTRPAAATAKAWRGGGSGVSKQKPEPSISGNSQPTASMFG